MTSRCGDVDPDAIAQRQVVERIQERRRGGLEAAEALRGVVKGEEGIELPCNQSRRRWYCAAATARQEIVSGNRRSPSSRTGWTPSTVATEFSAAETTIRPCPLRIVRLPRRGAKDGRCHSEARLECLRETAPAGESYLACDLLDRDLSALLEQRRGPSHPYLVEEALGRLAERIAKAGGERRSAHHGLPRE